jgi:CHASE2 domain-containing sensor protein
LGKDSVTNPFDSEDKHIVPGGHQNLIGKVPTTPGIFIHAQVLEMLINDRVINEFSGFWKILLEWVLLFMIAVLYVYLAHASMWFKPIVLPLSFVFIFILVYTALILRDNSIYWSVGSLNLQIVLLIEAVEFYEPISIWLNKKWRIKSYFHHEADH